MALPRVLKALLRQGASLKFKLTAVTVGLFILFNWALAFFSLTVLQRQFEDVLADRQLASARFIAAEIDHKLSERLDGLSQAAAALSAILPQEPDALAAFLARQSALHLLFSGGISIIGMDGRALADYPVMPGRVGTFYGDRDYFRNIVETHRPSIDKPVIGRARKRPVLNIAAPVLDGNGKLQAVIAGITDLSAPNFLGLVTNRALSGSGEFFVVSPRDKLIVAATDARRALQPTAPRGVNVMYDRLADGFEGSGMTTSSEGVAKFVSGARVPVANWIVEAALPADVAFRPLQMMQYYVLAVAAAMTLLAVFAILRMARTMLAPLEEAGQAMQRMTLGEIPLAQLPVRRDDEVGRLIGNFNMLVDDRKRYEAALSDSEQRFRRLVEAAPDAIFVQTGGAFAYVNAAALRLFGAGGEASLLGHPIAERLSSDSVCGAERFLVIERARQAVPPFEETVVTLDGRPVSVQVSAVPFDYGGDPSLLVFLRNITERKQAEEQIHFLAHYDALTKLPNRLLMADRFILAAAYADRAGRKAALLSLDLDNFKTVNDSLGHSVGDELLQAVALRLRECIRDTDTIARQGGDEFLLVLPDVDDTASVACVADKILQRLADLFVVSENPLATSASIGASIYPDDGADFDTLLKKADAAMYSAKEAGRNTYRFFDARMNLVADERLHLRHSLRLALDRAEFVLHYQPQIDLGSGAVVGAEALIRWNHPEMGLVPPGRFIAVAEESGLIIPMGEWALREACGQAMAWRRQGLPELVMAVNLSAVQFKRGNLEQTVVDALRESGLDPRFLELELTESILISDAENVLQTVRRLKGLGVKLSIDDFGTGYSSLAYLKRFAVDKVKIDQSFVRSSHSDPNDDAIVRAIIHMASSLGLRTIAEGVEDERLVDYLRSNRCDEAQGYHFGRPMPAHEFVAYLGQSTATA